jgi:hypothetical protein
VVLSLAVWPAISGLEIEILRIIINLFVRKEWDKESMIYSHWKYANKEMVQVSVQHCII